jgi:hypothetical protein
MYHKILTVLVVSIKVFKHSISYLGKQETVKQKYSNHTIIVLGANIIGYNYYFTIFQNRIMNEYLFLIAI